MSSSPTTEALVPIDQIRVEDRFRTEKHTPEELQDLAHSINKIGMLAPPVIDKSYNLIAGEGRYRAVKEVLGSKFLLCRIVDVDAKNELKRLQMERDENVLRKPFTHTERMRLTDAILNRMKAGEIPVEPHTPKREAAVKMAGTSVGEYQRTKEVVKSGDTSIIEQLDKGELSPNQAVAAVRERHGLPNKRKSEPDEVKDSLGNVVPQHLRDIFGDKTMAAAAEEVERAARIMQACEKWNQWIRADHTKQFTDLRNLIQDLTPYALCPRCQGPGCEHCRQQGWMPAWRYTEFMTGDAPVEEVAA